MPPTGGPSGGGGSASAVGGVDPNEKFGAAGFGPQAFIRGDTAIPYRVHFENLGPGSVPAPAQPAVVPAQRVVVTDQLSADLDWSSFRFTEFGFGDTFTTVPEGRQYHFAVVSMTFGGRTFDVEIELSFDVETGQVRAVFQSLDPDTGLPPDVATGFLPPEDGTGRGKGFVAFTVSPKAGLPTGTELRNVALIRFDGQQMIATNQVDPQGPTQGTDPNKEALNTIDAAAPSSAVEALPTFVTTAAFTVRWSGADDAGGSGVAVYDVHVSVDGGPFTRWLAATPATSAVFAGSAGHHYAFYSVATDNVGHAQSAPGAAQATTTVAGNFLTLRARGGDLELIDDASGTVVLRQPADNGPPLVLSGVNGDTTLQFQAPVSGLGRPGRGAARGDHSREDRH